MTIPTPTQVRLTIEAAPGSTNEAKRAYLFTQWQTVQNAVTSGVRNLSIPGLNGSLDGDSIEQYRDLLEACIDYLDSVINNDPDAGAFEPLGHTVDFSRRPMMW